MVEKLNIRLAGINDMKNVFDLSNDKTVRLNSINKANIEWEKHVAWFNDKISSPNSIFYIAEIDADFAGYCRLDKSDEDYIITIHICPKHRGNGLGTIIIEKICELNNDKDLKALVKEGNQASYKMFLKCGFVNSGIEKINNENYYKFLKVNKKYHK